jgi:type I restriction enzyme S subunit
VSQLFPEHWDVLPFSSAVNDVTSAYSKIQKSEYSETGRFPIVDQGQKTFGGYTDDESAVSVDRYPSIVFGDHTRIFKYIDTPFCLGADGAKVLEPKVKLNKKFLFYYLSSINIESAGYSRHFKYLKENVVPVPPMAEQQRIAAILDKADAICRKRQQAIQLADDFLRAVFLDLFGDPATNPKGWEVKSVAELIQDGAILKIQDGNHGNDHPKVSDFSADGIPFITANVVRRGKILFDQCYYLDRSWLDKLRIGFAKPRDVLISHKGSLGFTAVLDDRFNDYIFSPQTTYYRVNEEKLMPEYLKGYFDSGFFQHLFAQEGIQSTRAYLGITRQKELPIMIPTIQEQRRFVEVLSKHVKLSEKLFEPEAFSTLFLSLSQKAFKGEL